VTAPAPRWGLTDAALCSVARLLRRFHDATAGFDPTPYHWSHTAPPPFAGPGIAHNDLNLDNVVFRGEAAAALIDFDLAGPAAAVWDVAAAVRLWAPLRDPVDVTDIRRGHELHRLRLFVDTYGLDEPGRAAFLPDLRGSHTWMYEVVRDGARRGVPGFAAYWTPEAAARADRARTWYDTAADAITRALS
jgi:aminoglycoside phosphotransferase (APT) family kinase protein